MSNDLERSIVRQRATTASAGDMSPHFTRAELVAVGVGSGLLGGVALAAPLVIWDWAHTRHLAFELPMAATAWLFGLRHFSHAHYLAWPLVIGIALLAAYTAVSGVAFAALADRVYGATHVLTSIAAGFAWSVLSFVFFWDMLLPIARGGAPLRASSASRATFVAPNWVWILGFTLLGLVIGACYAALQTSSGRSEPAVERRTTHSPLERAA